MPLILLSKRSFLLREEQCENVLQSLDSVNLVDLNSSVEEYFVKDDRLLSCSKNLPELMMI